MIVGTHPYVDVIANPGRLLITCLEERYDFIPDALPQFNLSEDLGHTPGTLRIPLAGGAHNSLLVLIELT